MILSQHWRYGQKAESVENEYANNNTLLFDILAQSCADSNLAFIGIYIYPNAIAEADASHACSHLEDKILAAPMRSYGIICFHCHGIHPLKFTRSNIRIIKCKDIPVSVGTFQ